MTQAFRDLPYGPGNPAPLNEYHARVKPPEIHNVSREIGRNALRWYEDCYNTLCQCGNTVMFSCIIRLARDKGGPSKGGFLNNR